MELTDDMLKRIASQIANLHIRYDLLKGVLIQMGADSRDLDLLARQATEGPVFQKVSALVFEQLRGGH